MSAGRVLICDDNALNILMVRIVLEAEQFEVETAADGFEAIGKAASFRPELILMDIQMPGKDGLEVTRELKADARTQHICIIAFTAFAMRGDEAKMRAAGCDGYVSKPIDVTRFAAQVRGFLQAWRAPSRSGPEGQPR